MFLGSTVFEKNAMLNCKNSKLQNCPNLEFLQVSIASFSNAVEPRNNKFGLYQVYSEVNI